MHTTSPTLLQKLREANQPEVWERFVDLYTPLLLTWARVMGLQPADADDLVQEVFATLLQKVHQYDAKSGRFRVWLRAVCHNRWCDLQRKRGARAPTARAASDTVDDRRPMGCARTTNAP